MFGVHRRWGLRDSNAAALAGRELRGAGGAPGFRRAAAIHRIAHRSAANRIRRIHSERNRSRRNHIRTNHSSRIHGAAQRVEIAVVDIPGRDTAGCDIPGWDIAGDGADAVDRVVAVGRRSA